MTLDYRDLHDRYVEIQRRVASEHRTPTVNELGILRQYWDWARRFSAMNPRMKTGISSKPETTSPSRKIVKTFVKGGITYQIVGGKGIPKRMYKRENDTWKLIPVRTIPTVPRHTPFIKPKIKAIESVTVLNSPFAIPPTVLNKKAIKIK
jgi:hypothetical protein